MWYYANHNNIVPRYDHHLDFDEFQLKRNAHNTAPTRNRVSQINSLLYRYIIIIICWVSDGIFGNIITTTAQVAFVAFGLKNNMTQNNIGDVYILL